jgi:hypothetical protein
MAVPAGAQVIGPPNRTSQALAAPLSEAYPPMARAMA